uniref:Uncharacterized protein n=1 Tax=Rhizophora mucronata TaxID=61149 RepID=A0A2P2Q6C1_RHIMU
MFLHMVVRQNIIFPLMWASMAQKISKWYLVYFTIQFINHFPSLSYPMWEECFSPPNVLSLWNTAQNHKISPPDM